MTYAVKVRPAGASAWFWLRDGYGIRGQHKLSTQRVRAWRHTTAQPDDYAARIAAEIERDNPGVTARVVEIR